MIALSAIICIVTWNGQLILYFLVFLQREYLLEKRRPLCHRTIFAVLISRTFIFCLHKCYFQFDTARDTISRIPFPFTFCFFFTFFARMKKVKIAGVQLNRNALIKNERLNDFSRRVLFAFQFVRLVLWKRYALSSPVSHPTRLPFQRILLHTSQFVTNSRQSQRDSKGLLSNTFEYVRHKKIFLCNLCNLWASCMS